MKIKPRVLVIGAVVFALLGVLIKVRGGDTFSFLAGGAFGWAIVLAIFAIVNRRNTTHNPDVSSGIDKQY
jgi:hypothetical protein